MAKMPTKIGIKIKISLIDTIKIWILSKSKVKIKTIRLGELKETKIYWR